MGNPHELHGFPEGIRLFDGNFFQCFGNYRKLPLSPGIPFGFRGFPVGGSITLNITDRSLHRYFGSGIKFPLFRLNGFRQFGFYLFQELPVTGIDDHTVI